MTHYVNLEMNETTFLNLCDAVETAATHAEYFDELQELVHLVDFLEKEYDLKYLDEACFIHKVQRKDLEGKGILKLDEKYCFEYFDRKHTFQTYGKLKVLWNFINCQ